MGYWCTLHLFDDKKFYEKVVPTLKGDIGDLNSICLGFLKSHIPGGIEHLSKQESIRLVAQTIKTIHSISNAMDITFKIHEEFQKIQDYNTRRQFLNDLDGYYDFCKFVEYYLFMTCTDFYPHLPLGKGGLAGNFELTGNNLSDSILEKLDYWNEFLCGDGMGITNWISNEDVHLLYLDKENLHFTNNERAESFLTLLDIANENNLGFVVGVDMREHILEVLPGNKLTNSLSWPNKKTAGLLWRR